ncbi:hypothetical protein B484DRAFT_455841 [Ochromonadaceae sp. CCMP2298]|nr:hypothetical protein B484DRAFT_455841 [Ochromonadaceae sp. CCMP2298]
MCSTPSTIHPYSVYPICPMCCSCVLLPLLFTPTLSTLISSCVALVFSPASSLLLVFITLSPSVGSSRGREGSSRQGYLHRNLPTHLIF